MISVIVITYNEEENIRECLDSLKWCDEIIVVDSNSKDKTLEIAKEFTNNIITADSLSFGEKRNIGIEKSTGEWILWLDADERVTDELKNEILELIKHPPDTYKAFYINRRSFFINKFIKHCGWYPDYKLRLFKKRAGIKFDTAKVHEKLIYNGNTSRLKTEIIHLTDKTFEHYINKLNAYTTLSAEELYKTDKRSSFFALIFRPVFAFFKMYFLKLGILDGYMGLVLCSLSSIHVMVKYSKLFYLNKKS
ncbi:MAG: glycosyltransferase family 2 protein [Chlorobi bacterium]|nr:glycosyltransferase family 2 protein [Chlorobiota bacterium]MCI0716111.1 glycosyltransferase family 2 protein [Chlorobiota bacterium]